MNCVRSSWSVHRGRSAQRGVTVVEAGLVVSAAAAAVATLMVWFGPKSRAEEQDQAQRYAAVIAQAAGAWNERGETGCPTVSGLIERGDLLSAARLDDPWGTRFRIECDGQNVTVWSPGLDRQRGTADDVRLVAESD